MIPNKTAALATLHAHRQATKTRPIKALFDADPNRFAKFSRRHERMLLDFSKCALTDETLSLLLDLVRAVDLEGKRDAMFRGEKINETENRAVLHTALRRRNQNPLLLDGHNIMADIVAERAKMFALAEGVRLGKISGSTGKTFTDVVNLGIGGSDLGPAMATVALAPWHDGPKLHFVSNVDGAHLADTLIGLNPETTLFIIASKTFTTIETMTNAISARRFIAEHLGHDAVAHHFMAVTTALDKAAQFPVRADRITGFWDWVGGRYSIWSSIGLPLAMAIGSKNFEAFLNGAGALDEHFTSAPLTENLPVLFGLIGIWHRLICDYQTRALIPYDQRLARLPAYVQQLDMESNGKRVAIDGSALDHASGPIVWGEPGTNSQHAFFQLLHQGTDVIPIEFLIAAKAERADLKDHHDLLIANCLAQSEALLVGRSYEDAKAQLLARGQSTQAAEALAPHRVFLGNRPSLTLAYERLDPAQLGALIALYEHRVFVEAAIFGINAFDQWGVELGKELATSLLPLVKGETRDARANGSTVGLIGFLTKP
ncbi:MAG: glucose-6-phosphate isomerase [Hyphomicrobiales bacterium]